MNYLPSWGGNKDEKNKKDKHPQTQQGYNTRSSGRKEVPTRSDLDPPRQQPQEQKHGSSSYQQMGGSPMDCGDPYTTSNSVYGSSSGYDNHYGSQHGGHSQSGYQHGGGQCAQNDTHLGMHHQGHGMQPGFGMGQQQSQGHMFRSAQASKQMVYGVYGNCLTMLEELESRELQRLKHKPLPRSEIYLPEQRKHDDSTVQRKLETQLLLFQSQLKGCDKTIKEEVRRELTENTLAWNSQREKRKVPDGLTDKYAGKLIEVLKKGKTEHPKEFYEQPKIEEADMRDAMEGIMQGSHQQAQLDEEFKKDPKKKAKAPKVRRGSGAEEGAKRMARNQPHLANDVQEYNTSMR